MNRVALARLFLYVREAADNTGQRVEGIQRWCGGAPHESWCCYFVTFILDIEFQGNAPIARLGACQNVLDLAHKNSWVIPAPEVECLVISIDANGHAHHIGICTGVQGEHLTTIAGNTSADGSSANGDRVAEHEVALTGKVFVRVPARG